MWDPLYSAGVRADWHSHPSRTVFGIYKNLDVYVLWLIVPLLDITKKKKKKKNLIHIKRNMNGDIYHDIVCDNQVVEGNLNI